MPMRSSSALIRATIFVKDLERASAFYRALGLEEVYFEGVLDDASASIVLGFPDHCAYQVRILKRPGPNYGMIGLFQLAGETETETLPEPLGPARRGEVALVFYVPSMQSALEALRRAGATWAPEPVLFRMEHRQQLEACLRDPDGVLINLVETDPSEQENTVSELVAARRRTA
jgi:catechol 2,3-dioxygenase-like lactoylglutathione lyase family enzyme